LLADFAREGGTFPVKFRGVARHLAYIIGWGYGQHNTDPAVEDEDRPEVARISDPGTPTIFQPEHYFIVGMQGDPIIGGDLVAQRFAFFKAAESYLLNGYDRKTFGVTPLDPQHGLLASKLHTSVAGACFFWSLAGPRVMTGEGSKDLAEALWLDGPVPDPLASATPREQAHSYYDRDHDTVHFVFGRWDYVLHLADGMRWTYDVLGVGISCAGIVYTGGSSFLDLPPGVTPGVASYLDPSYVPGDADPTFYVPWTWTPVSPGGQRAEVWAKEAVGGTWAQYANVPASNGFAVIKVTEGKFLVDYDLQVRFTQFGVPAVGYEDPDPDMWPAGSLVVVAAGGTPAMFAMGRYNRFSPTLPGFYGGLARLPGIGQASPAAYGYEVEWAAGLGGPWTAPTAGTSPPWGDVRMPNTEYGNSHYYRLRATLGVVNGGWLVIGPIKLAPEPPTGVVIGPTNNPGGPNDDIDGHSVLWSPPALLPGPVVPHDGPYDIRARHYDTMAFIGAWSSIQAVGVGVHLITFNVPGVDPSTTGTRTAQAQVRSNNQQGDVSDWVDATIFEP
jgi:hypothetical protein